MDHGRLPPGLALVRTTAEFDQATVPAGLRRAHSLAAGVWGVLHLRAGTLRFVWEGGDAAPADLVAGDSIVIPPEVRHHVEPTDDARFVVEFHR